MRRSRPAVLAVLVLAVLALAAPDAGAGPGDPDPGFDGDGFAFVAPPAGYKDSTHLRAVTVTPDGGILVAGLAYRDPDGADLVVGRLTPSGHPDPGFAGGSLVPIAPMEGALMDSIGIAARPDGGAVVTAPVGPYDATDLGVAALTPSGALDPGFGSGGVVRVKPPEVSAARPRAVAVQPDGRIVVAGYADIPTPGGLIDRVLVARFLTDGQPDPSFDGDGYAIPQFGPSPAKGANAVALGPDGRITVAGFQGPSPYAGLFGRLTPDGTPDATFASTPFTSPGWMGAGPEGTVLYGIVLPADGSTIVAGRSDTGSYVRRVGPQTLTDSSTSVYAKTLRSGTDRDLETQAATGDSAGRVFLTGVSSLYGPPATPGGAPGPLIRTDAGLLAVDTAGNPDPAVGGSPAGWRTYEVPGHRLAEFPAVAMAPDGDIVLAGRAQPDVGSIFHGVVLRLQALPPVPSQGGGDTGGGGQQGASTGPKPGGTAKPAPATARLTGLTRRVAVNLRTGRGKARARCGSPAGDLCVLALKLRAGHVTLGAASGRLPGGRTGTVAFKLSRRGRSALRRAHHHRLKVTLSGTSHDRAGRKVAVLAHLTLVSASS